MVLSLSAKGPTHGEISAHLREVYAAEVSKQTISAITDSVVAGMTEWQYRPSEVRCAVLIVAGVVCGQVGIARFRRVAGCSWDSSGGGRAGTVASFRLRVGAGLRGG